MPDTALYIDPDTRDLALDDEGLLLTLSGDAVVAQAVRLALLVYKEEWPLDLSHGTDWSRVLGEKLSRLSDEEIAEVLREAVFQESEVGQVMAIELDRAERKLNVSLEGTLKNGSAFSLEVSMG